MSDALSTLRLRCGEPVRFRLMVGMFNSGGGSGELQTFGLKFINTFIDSADSLQDRLYIQAELAQAGFDPKLMSKTTSRTSPWYEKLLSEVRRWESLRIDVDALQKIALSAEKMRSKLVMFERRVASLMDERNVLTSMERRLQERCAELQKEVKRLRETQSALPHKSPVALPRQGMKNGTTKQSNSEHEDEGISGSDTGQSISPEPEPYRSQKSSVGSNKFDIILTEDMDNDDSNKQGEEEVQPTIEDVIEELENIVSDAERDMNDANTAITDLHSISETFNSIELYSSEYEIIPSNLLPAPPKKTKSLVQLFSNPSDLDSSEYMIVEDTDYKKDFFDDTIDHNRAKKIYHEEPFIDDVLPRPDILQNPRGRDTGANRALLNVIMDAREKERHACHRAHSLERNLVPPHQFGGVFFMTDMMGRNKTVATNETVLALEPRKSSKSLDRLANCGVNSMINIIEERSKQLNVNQRKSSSGNIANPKSSVPINISNNYKYKPGALNYGLPISALRGTSRTSSNVGSKITDLPSGLF